MWIILRVLIGVVVLALLEYYFTRKLNRVFKTLFPDYPRKKKYIIIYSFLVLLNLYPVILIFNAIYAAVTKQSVAFPQNIFADYLLLYPFWVLIILILQVSALFFFVDLLKLIFYPLYKKHKHTLYRVQVKIFLALTVFFAIYIPARIIYDYNTVEVRNVEYQKNNLPKELDGFKIAFISDVQADRYTDEKRLKRYVDKINDSKPDLVLVAGDVITSTPDYIENAGKYLGMIKSKYGTYSCVGDHDNWAYRQDYERSLREVSGALNHYNVEMPDNELRYFEIDSSRIGVTFITNTYVSEISETTLQNIASSNKAEFKIFLTHQPQDFLINSAVKNNYNLFLAGHTHGGQITLVFPFVQLTPTLIETRYIKGDFYFNDMLAIVCGGLGMSLAPVRYNSTPEIVLITLKNI
ncbi:MAG: metallophosphoesterase [Ignavibacteriaceae bacterium]|nr:metallophosphoesterase [Ignavibacteriaceae bacterium]